MVTSTAVGISASCHCRLLIPNREPRLVKTIEPLRLLVIIPPLLAIVIILGLFSPAKKNILAVATSSLDHRLYQHQVVQPATEDPCLAGSTPAFLWRSWWTPPGPTGHQRRSWSSALPRTSSCGVCRDQL